MRIRSFRFPAADRPRPPTMVYRLHLLDRPTVQKADGSAVDLPLGKPFALFAFLAVRAQPVPREDLAILLWPRSPPERGRSSVRQALWVLRRALDDELLVDGETGLSVDQARVRTDLQELGRAVRDGRLDELRGLWGGGFLNGLSVAGAPGWLDWVDSTRHEWEMRLGEALANGGRRGTEAGDAVIARRCFEHALELQPYLERRHLDLVDHLLEFGAGDDAAEALARARAWVDSPDDAEMALREGRLAALRRRAEQVVAVQDTHPELEFVGRTEALDLLRGAERATRRGRSSSAAVIGPAGIGKTRLVQEYLAAGPPPEWGVAQVKLVEADRGLEWAALIDLIRQLAGMRGASGISAVSASVLAGLSPSLGPVLGVAEGHALTTEASVADALFDLVDAVAGEAGLVVWVDDVQWADATSRRILFRLIRSSIDMPVMFIVGCRSGEADVGPLREVRREVEGGRLDGVTLGPLTPPEARELIVLSMTLRHPALLDEVAARITAISKGVPLAIETVVHGLRSDGLLTRAGDEWWLEVGAAEQVRAPAPLMEWLRDRVAGLDGPARSAFATLAAARGPLSIEELENRVAGSDGAGDVHSAVRGLRDAGLVSAVHGRLSVHDLAREAWRSVGSRRAGRASAWHRRPVAQAAALAAMVAAVAATAFVAPRAWTEFGGAGTTLVPPGYDLVLTGPDGAGVFEFDASADSLVEVEFFDGGPSWNLNRAAVRLADGRIAFHGAIHPGVDQAPDGVIQFWGEQSPTVVRSTPADDHVAGLTPDGRWGIVFTADSAAGHFRSHHYLQDLRTGRVRSLYAPDVGVSAVHLSPDGRRLMISRRSGGPLILMDLQGRVTDSIPFGDVPVSSSGWCGLRTAIVSSLPAGEPIAWELVDLRDGTRTRVAREHRPAGQVECVEEGARIAYVAHVDGVRRLVIANRGEGAVHHVGLPGDFRYAFFLPRSVGPVPDRLVHPGPLELNWGQAADVPLQIRDQDGNRFEGPARWVARDPGVVGVRGSRIVGNAPGRTVLRAEVDGLFLDSVAVRVAPVEPADALFADRFDRGYEADWHSVGHPLPRVGMEGGDHVLHLTGDGSYSDGIVSRESWRLPRGATLELEVALPFTERLDRQQVNICLRVTDLRAPLSRTADDWSQGETACIRYPAEELELLDRAAFALTAFSTALGAVRLPDGRPLSGWNHLALQLRPDGHASVVVNREVVFSYPNLATWAPDAEWRIVIHGRSVDTDLRIRNVVLWEGARYR